MRHVPALIGTSVLIDDAVNCFVKAMMVYYGVMSRGTGEEEVDWGHVKAIERVRMGFEALNATEGGAGEELVEHLLVAVMLLCHVEVSFANHYTYLHTYIHTCTRTHAHTPHRHPYTHMDRESESESERLTTQDGSNPES